MPIQGLTDRGLSFPQIGVIRKGSPKQKKTNQQGQEYEIQGKDLDHFRVEFDSAEEKAAEMFHRLYGEKPNALKVAFPFNEVDRVWDAWLEAYTSNRLIARSDGEKIIYWREGKQMYVKNGLATADRVVTIWKKIEDKKTEPLAVTMKAEQPVAFIPGMVFHRTEKTLVEAKPVGRLRVTLYELKRLGYLLLSTTSMNDIISLGGPDSGELGAIKSFASNLGLPFAGVPLILRRKPKSISYMDANGKQSKMLRWLVHLEADPEYVEKAMQMSRHLAMPAIAFLEQNAASELKGVNEPEVIDEEDVPPTDMTDVEDGYVKEEPEEPKATDEPRIPFNDGKVIIAVSRAMSYDTQTASQTVHEAHKLGRLADKVTMSEVKTFCEGLLK